MEGSPKPFTHLHLHTQYSILDGAANIKRLIAKVKEFGMDAVAITDHGNMFGVMEFVQEAEANGIKPIIGCEVYVARHGRTRTKDKSDRSGNHLILLAKNETGYHNLSRIVSLGHTEGFYYTPRVDKEDLRRYSEGLIASSACLGGELPQAVMHQGIEKAREVALEFREIFGEDYYIELQRHGLPEQQTVNEVLLQIARENNIKVLATNDVHFIHREDYEAHKILICLNTNSELDDMGDLHYSGNEYLKSSAEMAELFKDIPEAFANTRDVVDKCEEYSIKVDVILPKFPLPEGFTNEDEYLEHLTWKGAEIKYSQVDNNLRERLSMELEVVRSRGYAGYFLIVQDFINEARKMDVLVGPGRGSAAGSAVAYCIGITNVDPIRYNLLFERFLNPERKSMPDIDVDFDDEGRDKVIKYVEQKYGRNRVAQIVTFGTMAAKTSIRDVARVLKLPLPEADRLAKLVPERPGITLKEAFAEVPELKQAKESGEELVRKTLEFAETLEGSARHTGLHACGVIIGPDDLIEHVPLAKAKDSSLYMTQYEGQYIEAAGMLKMDFLGLKTLSIIKDALENINHRHSILINIDEIPFDDRKTFELYQRGETIGTFQFESEGMRSYLIDLKPNNIEDLIAMNALYRPGPIFYIPEFIKRKHGESKVEYPHPLLVDILRTTYGIMVYQEQIMQAAQIMGGFTLGKADDLRKAMGKKKKDIMEKQKVVFIEGAAAKSIDKETAEGVYETMAKFAEYGFNRSHSAAYSMVAYQTAYLKAHYPAEYMAAVLTHNLNDIKKITFFIEESRRQKIDVLGPDVNESDLKFRVNDKGQIRFGLGAVKGVGEAVVNELVAERKANGPYRSIFELVKRVNLRTVNRRSLEALAQSGAFDSFTGIHRAQYFQSDASELSMMEKLVKHGAIFQEKQQSMQQSLFGGGLSVEIQDPSVPPCPEWTELERLHREKEVIGFYVSGHPLDAYKIEMFAFLRSEIEVVKTNLFKFKETEVTVAGMITEASHKVTKNGDPFGTFTVEDYNDSMQFALFRENYLKFKHFLLEGTFVQVRFRVQARFKSETQLETRVSSMTMLSELIEKQARQIVLFMPLMELTPNLIRHLKDLIAKHPGKCPLQFTINTEEDGLLVNLPSRKQLVNAGELAKELQEMESVRFRIF
jgi:DNA polymerase III subunit alpha